MGPVISTSSVLSWSPWVEEGNSLDYLRCNPTAKRSRPVDVLSERSYLYSIIVSTSSVGANASALEYLHSGIDTSEIIVHGDCKAVGVSLDPQRHKLILLQDNGCLSISINS